MSVSEKRGNVMCMKVMLVDDEPFILQGLQKIIDWEAEECEIVKTASNGVEAYEYIREKPVDMVIADIRMPEMSGLELLEKMRKEIKSQAYFIILSGYNEFAYAQKAMRYTCLEYLLKPIQKESLLASVRKAVREKNQTEQTEQKQQQFRRAYLVQRMANLLRGTYEEDTLDYVKKAMEFVGGIRYVKVDYDGSAWQEDLSDEERKGRYRHLFDNCREFLGDDNIYCMKDVLGYEANQEIGLFYCDYLAEKRGLCDKEFMDAFVAAAGEGLEEPVLLLLGKRVDDISRISHSYSTAHMLKSSLVFSEKRNIYEYESELQMSPSKVVLCKQSLDRLIKAVEQNDRGEINGSVDALFGEMEGIGSSEKILSMNIHYLFFRLIHLAVEQDESVNQEEVMSYISENVFDSGVSRGSRAHLRQFASEYAEYLIQLRKNVSRGVLQDIEREIEEHYAENLTLKDLSRKYYLNSSYLGQVFRKKYGQSFKDYLTCYRIDMAAELLRKTDKKISTIAEEVGYKDTDYFINKFIEQKGATPTKYRRQMN